MNNLQRILGHTSVVEGERESLRRERRLWGWFKNDRIACDERGKNGIDHDEIWITDGQSDSKPTKENERDSVRTSKVR